MENKRKDKLYLSLVNLVEIVQESYLERQDILSYLSKLKVAKEFGTVKLCTVRGSGHTSAMAKLIKEKFNKVIVVVPTMKAANIFNQSFPDIKDKVYLCSPDSFDEKLLGLSDYQAVMIDCSSLLSQSKIDKLYEMTLFGMNNPLYVFME